MIFSESEREYYRKKLEAACKAGDVKRVKRLIDQIRLLGDIRENAPKIQTNLKGIEEYIKQQKALNREVNKAVEYIKQQEALNREFDEHSALNYPDENPYGTLSAPEKDMLDDILDRCFLGDEDIVLTDWAEMPFRGVLQQGFKDSGWTW